MGTNRAASCTSSLETLEDDEVNCVRPKTLAGTAGFVAALACALSTSGCHRSTPQGVFIDTAVVARRPLVITVAATGIIQPEAVVQVKSKASGQIVKLPVKMGTQVKPGDLIAQIDPRDPQSRYNQAVAALNAAKANLDVTRAQKDRADQLFAQRALTAPEHEAAVLAYANAQSQLASAQTNLEVAQIQLADVTIRAPEAGTIIDKQVSEGQVIASATNNVSGGTTLVTIANLGHLIDSALVTESDIGRVRDGQSASITVDAYPNREFHGVVENVSPQAVTVQSVTMFPVIIRLDNSSGLLKPGMNSDVTVLVDNRTNALLIPNDAIGSPEDLMLAAAALGVDRGAIEQAGRPRRPSGAEWRQGAGSKRAASRGERYEDPTGDGEPRALAAVSDTDQTNGDGDLSAAHPAVVLALADGKWTPRRVMLGDGNYDDTEVLSGLEAGDRVALVAEVRVQAARDSNLTRMQNRSGLPGMGGGGGGGGGGGRGGQRRGGR
jgi:HlyD family secretion protein